MKVIYISYDGMCDPVGASQVLPYIAELSKKEIEFFLISFEKPEKFESGEAAVRAQIGGLSVRWFPLRYTKNPPVISTMLDLRKMKKLCRRICGENNIDFIHARSYISALAAMNMWRRKKIPYIFDMRGFWADERIDGGIWSLKNPVFRTVYGFFKKKEKQLLRDASAVVSLTHTAKNFMIDKWNVPEKKIHVIPCAADYAHFAERDKSVVDEFRLKNHVPVVPVKTLMYIGSTGTWYMLQEMFDFYAAFRNQFPRSQFVLCINETNSIVEAMKQKFPYEITVLQRIPRSEMPLVLSLADYSIMFIKPAFSKMASSPIKLGESLAMGVPVICNAGVGDLGTIEQEGFGVVVNKASIEEYRQACVRLAAFDFSADDIRARSEFAYDLQRNVDKYLLVYGEITS
ncbi:Glycosyltransferase Family 4 [anaerobic digester metagenome]